MGTRNSNNLTAAQKAALVLWLKERAEDGDTRTYGCLAAVAAETLGFAVTESNVQGWWNAVNGPRRTYPERGKMSFAAMLEALDGRVHSIEARLAALEKRVTW